jgi:sec-independent protein translocase protein TatB
VFNLGAGEIVVILLLALIFIGPSKLPDLATGLGKLIREIRKATSDVKNEITIDDSFRKPFEELRDAVTLHPDELKRRDQIKRSVEEARKRAEAEAARAAAAQAAVAEVAAVAISSPPEAALPAAAAAPAVSAELAPTPAPVEPPTEAVAPAGFVPPTVPPPGTVARVRKPTPAPPESAASEPAPPLDAAEDSSAARIPRPRQPTPSGILTSAPPLPGAARVTPPISSLEGDRANITQSLTEADLLAGMASASRPAAPPPLPGLDRTHPAPVGRSGAPRATPPTSSLTGDRANATQTLSESDLLPPGAPRPTAAVKPPPPPLPGSKKA